MWIENILSFICITQATATPCSTHAVIPLIRNRSALPYAVPHSSIRAWSEPCTCRAHSPQPWSLQKEGLSFSGWPLGSRFCERDENQDKATISINKCPRLLLLLCFAMFSVLHNLGLSACIALFSSLFGIQTDEGNIPAPRTNSLLNPGR